MSYEYKKIIKRRPKVTYLCHEKTGSLYGGFETIVKKEVNALVNTNGGIIVFGVDSRDCVVGVRISRKDEDEMKLQIDREIRNMQPTILPVMYRVDFRDLNFWGNYVLEIKVSSCSRDMIYQTGDRKMYVVEKGCVRGPLYPQEIKKVVLKKFKKSYLNTLPASQASPSRPYTTGKSVTTCEKGVQPDVVIGSPDNTEKETTVCDKEELAEDVIVVSDDDESDDDKEKKAHYVTIEELEKDLEEGEIEDDNDKQERNNEKNQSEESFDGGCVPVERHRPINSAPTDDLQSSWQSAIVQSSWQSASRYYNYDTTNNVPSPPPSRPPVPCTGQKQGLLGWGPGRPSALPYQRGRNKSYPWKY